MPSYSGLSDGQVHLGGALIALPRHRFDEGKEHYLRTLVEKFAGVPDEVLDAVADEINEMTYAGEMMQQPRYQELATMIATAQTMRNALAMLVAQPLPPVPPMPQRKRRIR